MSEELGVRIGTAEDVDDIMALALSACEENGFVEPNPGKLLQEIWHGLTLEKGVVGVIGERGKPEGAVLLRIGSMWYSDHEVLEEKAIFIHPDYSTSQMKRMQKNLDLTAGLVNSQRVLLALTQKGVSREDSYRLVQKHAMRAWNGEGALLDLLKADSEVTAKLPAKELEMLFDLAYHFKQVDTIFARVFGA